MMLSVGTFSRASDLSDKEAAQINDEYIWRHKFQATITDIFLGFYSEHFEGEAHLQKKLIAEQADQESTGKSFANLNSMTLDGLIASAKEAVDRSSKNILGGDYTQFSLDLQRDLLDYTLTNLRQNLYANKDFLNGAMDKLLDELYKYIETNYQSNRMPILLGMEGKEFSETKARIISKLRRFSIRLHLNKALFIISLYADASNTFTPEQDVYYAKESDVYIVDQLRGDIQDETDEHIESEVIPACLQMFAKKKNTNNPAIWHFINVRVNTIIGLTLRRHQQKMLFGKVQKQSLSQPGNNLDNVDFGSRFKRFIVSNWEKQGFPSLLPQERQFFYLDYLACKPEAIEQTEHTLDIFDLMARFNGNINNYLFFIRYFKYFEDVDSNTPQAAIFEALYKALLGQRVLFENVSFLTRNWVDYIKNGEYYGHFKNTAQAPVVPAVIILTAVVFDPEINFQADIYNAMDATMTHFNAISHNNFFLVDYIPFNGVRGFPEVQVNTLKTIVIPQIGEVTQAEHDVLSSPASLKVVKDMFRDGKKLIKMTDLDPTFQSDEDVFVYLYEPKNAACDHSREELLTMF